MRENQTLIIDVINIMPDGVDCYVEAPSLDDEVVLNLMKPTKYDYFTVIKLDAEHKKILIKRILDGEVHEYFQRVEIRDGDKLLFEGYDGVEFGIISKDVALPADFARKHINQDSCNISADW